MLLISLDEAGRFESPKENEQGNLVAGIIYDCLSYSDIEKEKERIEKWFIKCCNETLVNGLPCVYPNDLHNRWQSGAILNVKKVTALKKKLIKTMPEFIQGTGEWEENGPKGKYYIYGLVGNSEGITKYKLPNLSNLINDGIAGNRYEHMAYRTLENVLFYNPYLYDDKIVLDIATRQLVTNNNDKSKEAKKLGYEEKSQNHFSLTVQKPQA